MTWPLLSSVRYVFAIALCLISFQFWQIARRLDLSVSAVYDSDGRLYELYKGQVKAKHYSIY